MASAFSLRRIARIALMAMLAAGASVPLASSAQSRGRQPVPAQQARMDLQAPRTAATRSEGRSLSDAVRRVQRTTGGHILGAERVPFDGRDINRVKYMDERGRVRYMDDPAQQHRSQPRQPRAEMSSLRGDHP